MLSGIAPVIAQVGEAAERGGTPPALVGALQAMAATMKEVQEQVDSYTGTWNGFKYVVAKAAEEELRACLEELDRQLNLVSAAISGQTYVEVLKSHGMLEELKLGVFGTETHLAKIRGEMATAKKMEAMGKRMMDKLAAASEKQDELLRRQAAMTDAQERGQAEINGKFDAASKKQGEVNANILGELEAINENQQKTNVRARTKSLRDQTVDEAEIPMEELTIENEPLTTEGAFSSVYKGTYGRIPVAIKVQQTGGRRNERGDKARSIIREIATMKQVRSA
ncbi:hypothetical protein TeGR_g4601 [Tetraparma gracilis]|uniref:Uncharacterized protein n=1 Tax=Tetraparma gracilis TaxID=2962635 RepID=A0ABQ6N1C1_9STRA|nr:hypothetical protein TeGR_g4601 [Tetraparma gracilis]